MGPDKGALAVAVNCRTFLGKDTGETRAVETGEGTVLFSAPFTHTGRDSPLFNSTCWPPCVVVLGAVLNRVHVSFDAQFLKDRDQDFSSK